MPTFSFSSQGGTNLSERIAMINARQKAKMSAVQDEDATEEALIQLANVATEEEPSPAEIEEGVILNRAVLCGSSEKSTYTELAMLTELAKKVDDLAADIKKMNKHINSIVKSLKKA